MAMKNLDYDYCHAAPVLEWMSQKWALVAMMRIDESCRERTNPKVSIWGLCAPCYPRRIITLQRGVIKNSG